MNRINYFLKALVLAIMLRCTMDYLLPTPEKLTFKLLDGFLFGMLVCFLFFGLLVFLRNLQKNRSYIYAEKIY